MNYDSTYITLLIAAISFFGVGLIVGTQLPSINKPLRDSRGRFVKKAKAKPSGV